MRINPPPADLMTSASRIVWFEAPEKALADPARFFAYAMRYATHRDMDVVRRHFTDDELRELLERVPPGIVDARSWAYWHLKLGKYPPPPLPERRFD